MRRKHIKEREAGSFHRTDDEVGGSLEERDGAEGAATGERGPDRAERK